jgi:Spy/CpxP family protein refolding chaperone
MTDTTTGLNENGPEPTHRSGRRWRGAIIGAALFAVGTASGFAVATAHGTPWWMLGAGKHHRLDPERIAAHADRRVDKVLSRVNATQDQRDKVKGITKSAITDLSTMGVMPWEARGKFIELLRADTIDPAAFEALRAEQISKADAASKRLVQAVTEAATVLTPDQRRQLTERWEKHAQRDKVAPQSPEK